MGGAFAKLEPKADSLRSGALDVAPIAGSSLDLTRFLADARMNCSFVGSIDKLSMEVYIAS